MPPFQPRDDPRRSKGANRAIRRASRAVSRASKWPVGSLARGKAASTYVASMPDTERMPTTVSHRRNCTWSGN